MGQHGSYDVNVFIGTGRLTRDADGKYTPRGAFLLESALAISGYEKVGDEYVESPMFIDFVWFGDRAERNVAKLEKGTLVTIQGRLGQDRWEDRDGNRRQKHKIVVERLYFGPRSRE